MKPERIKQLLPLVGSKYTGQRQGWILGHCPMRWNHGGIDKNPSFAVSYDPKKKSRCKCLSCGYSGDLMDLMLDLKFRLKKEPLPGYSLALAIQIVSAEFEEMELTVADIPEFEAKEKRKEILFPENWLTGFKPVSAFPDAMAYCKSRGLPPGLLKNLDVRFDPLQQRVAFPYRNFNKELMGMQGRYIHKIKDEKAPGAPLRYYQYGYKGERNSHIWMGEDKVQLDAPVVLCEGPFDYAKICQVYPNVVASFTTGLSYTKVRRMADADEFISFYDHGKGGDAARAAIRKFLPKMPMVDIIPSEDEGDPGAMSLEQIYDYLSEYLD